MEVTLAEFLTVYGPLGILALVGLISAAHMFRVLQHERGEHTKLTNEMVAEHRSDMQAMVERYIQTSTTQIEQYYNLAEKLQTVVDSALRRLERGGV